MPLKLNKETVEFIRENFEVSLFSKKYKTAPGIGNSLVFIKQATVLEGTEPVNVEISVRWTEEGARQEYVEVYFKSYTKRRVYTSRYDFSLSNRIDVKERLISLINTHENYTKKFFIVTLFKNIQEDRRKETGHYLSGETNKLMQSLKEIDRIDTSVYSDIEISPPSVYFTDGEELSFDKEDFFTKLAK
jgi:hypothetical protein